MTVVLDDRFKLRRGTAANLATVNEVPLEGEIVYETDQGLTDGKYKVKIGDGSTHYNDLPYMQLGGGVESIVPGGGIDVDTSDPKNPIVSSTLGSIALSGRVATYAALPSGLGSGDAGKAYYVESDELIYIWSGSAWPPSGSGVRSNGALRAAKKTDDPRASTVTQADDGDLRINLPANSFYSVRCFLIFSCASATPKPKFGLAYSGTISYLKGTQSLILPGGTTISYADYRSYVNADLPFVRSPSSWPAGEGVVWFDLAIATVTAGTFSLQWAQQVSNAVPVILKAGSYIQAAGA